MVTAQAMDVTSCNRKRQFARRQQRIRHRGRLSCQHPRSPTGTTRCSTDNNTIRPGSALPPVFDGTASAGENDFVDDVVLSGRRRRVTVELDGRRLYGVLPYACLSRLHHVRCCNIPRSRSGARSVWNVHGPDEDFFSMADMCVHLIMLMVLPMYRRLIINRIRTKYIVWL